MLVIGSTLIALIKVIELQTVWHLLVWIAMFATLMLFGFFLLSQTLSVSSAKKIREFTDQNANDIRSEG